MVVTPGCPRDGQARWSRESRSTPDEATSLWRLPSVSHGLRPSETARLNHVVVPVRWMRDSLDTSARHPPLQREELAEQALVVRRQGVGSRTGSSGRGRTRSPPRRFPRLPPAWLRDREYRRPALRAVPSATPDRDERPPLGT